MRGTLVFIVFIVFQLSSTAQDAIGEYPPFTKWYQNPLGVTPIKLHTANGIMVPALVAGVMLALLPGDSIHSEKFSCFTEGGASFGYYANETTWLYSNNGIVYRIRNYLSVGMEASVGHAHDRANNTWGVGIRPFFRFHLINRPGASFFFQSGAGLILFKERFPKPSGFFGDFREGTRLNGSPRYGLGVSYKLKDRLTLNAGIWHDHFSNGNRAGKDRNPGYDGNGFSLGMSWM